MCERCHTTAVDPNDTDYIDAIIEGVEFGEETYVLAARFSDGDVASVSVPPIEPPPVPDERLRIYGVSLSEGGGSMRGIVIGTGERERRVFYRTAADNAAVEARMADAMRDLFMANLLLQFAPPDAMTTEQRATITQIRDFLRDALTPKQVGDTTVIKVPIPFDAQGH